MNTPPGQPDYSDNRKLWHPQRFTPTACGHPWGNMSYAVCILNQPLMNKEHLLKLCDCDHSKWTICADGGANQLKDLNLTADEEEECRLQFICGDLDSVRPEVLTYYSQKGVTVVHDTDQYSTDLRKCLRQLSQSNSHNVAGPTADFDVVIFGGLGGRADQAFSLIHQLYALASDSQSLPGIEDVYLITKESIIFLLEKGHNEISTPVAPDCFTANVGILPVGRPAIITTHGLEWDVMDWPTEFGGQVSTSNHITEDTVVVSTTERVLFTMEFAAPES